MLLQVLHYQTSSGVQPVCRWMDSLDDRKTRSAILRRIDRIGRGLFGDCKPCAGGVWELRIDIGPGYRIYYAQLTEAVVLLSCAGNKKSQVRDIERAESCLRDFKERLRRQRQ